MTSEDIERTKNFIKFNVFIKSAFPCEGGLEYLHRSPASRRRRRKENPVPGV
jgi:hypothetical protein